MYGGLFEITTRKLRQSLGRFKREGLPLEN